MNTQRYLLFRTKVCRTHHLRVRPVEWLILLLMLVAYLRRNVETNRSPIAETQPVSDLLQAVQRLARPHRDCEGGAAPPLLRRSASLDRFHLKVHFQARPGKHSTLLRSAAYHPHGRQQRCCRRCREDPASLRERRHVVV